ncbi:MAG TPA: carboxypeptidase-like regulatory domain-containing protein [Pyrinomonadaceae bacterium]
MFSAIPLLLITLLAGNWTSILSSQEPASGSLVFNLTNSRGRALKKVAVSIRLDNPEPPGRPISKTLTTDGNGNLVIDNIPASTCSYVVRLEAVGFDDHSEDNIVIKSGQVTAKRVSLDSAQEISFARIDSEKTAEFLERCSRLIPSPKRLPIIHRAFTDGLDWEAWWHNYGIEAPSVDFKKHGVAALVKNASGQPLAARIRRITYNPRNKRTVVRLSQETFDVHITVVACEADFVFFAANPGEVVFR